MKNMGWLLRTGGLELGYGRRAVLRHVDLTIDPGQLWFFLGPNGQGKTTLARALLGCLGPSGGTLERCPEFSRPGFVSFVPQRCDLDPTLSTTVREFLSLGLARMRIGRAETRRRILDSIDRVGLSGLAGANFSDLSGGQRQRALVARAIVRRPSFLVVDEPTTGLDLGSQEILIRILRQLNDDEGLTLVFITHDLALAARHATHVALFHDGRVDCGDRSLLLDAARLGAIWGLPIDLSAVTTAAWSTTGASR